MMTLQSILNPGLGRQLLSTILFLVTLPALVVAFLSYNTAQKELYKATVNELQSITALQNNHLRSYVERAATDLQIEADRRANSELLKRLVDSYQQSGLPLQEFVNSYQWAVIAEEHAGHLKAFETAHDYYDVLLIDTKGNILFTLDREDDLGTNLQQGAYAKTHFANTFRKVLSSGKLAFSDFKRYAPSEMRISGFFVSNILSDDGDTLGFIATQIHVQQIEDFLRNNTNETKLRGVQSFLIGTDLGFRTRPQDHENELFLQHKLIAPEVQYWVSANVLNARHDTLQNHAPLSYKGHEGDDVLGVLHSVKIADKDFIIVAEIPKSNILAPITDLAALIVLLFAVTIALVIFVTIPLTQRIVSPILSLADLVSVVSKGDYSHKSDIKTNNELNELALGLNKLIDNLGENEKNRKQREWLQDGLGKINDLIRGEQKIAPLSQAIIRFICQYLDSPLGAFYVTEIDRLRLSATYACSLKQKQHTTIAIGEGLLGQAAMEHSPLEVANLPDNYFKLVSGLGQSQPRVLALVPIRWNDKTVAVLELGLMSKLSALQKQLLELLTMPIAVALNTAHSQEETKMLLARTQQQAEELSAREETLQVTNRELELKATELEETSTDLQSKNLALDAAKQELLKKAQDLELTSKYKSEFLANMSHELRTPLNSLLILAKLLADNKHNNLEKKQVEYAQTIHDSGTDLLNLINDILDLAKIESGHMKLQLERVELTGFCRNLERKLKPLARQKGITFSIHLSQQLPGAIITDTSKLDQVIKNLTSNAIKFTEQGEVSFTIDKIPATMQKHCEFNISDGILIQVKDQGIGIPADKQALIFEAFQQVDGTISRKFGGTGLGLSISREMVNLLGGYIGVESVPDKGSTFFVCLPTNPDPQQQAAETQVIARTAEPQVIFEDKSHSIEAVLSDSKTVKQVEAQRETYTAPDKETPDDRKTLKPGERSILIIEDDPNFANILASSAKERQFKVLVATDGETGLHFADYYRPSGIILDIGLPGLDGKQVLNRLKENLELRHIPVQIISGHDASVDARQNGAIGCLTKPISLSAMNDAFGKIEGVISREVKDLLLIEDNDKQAHAISELIGEGGDVNIVTAVSGEQALHKLKHQHFDCIVLDLGLPDMSGMQLLQEIQNNDRITEIPVVIYTGQELSNQERSILDTYSRRIIYKNANSPERLLDDTALFLHRVESKLPPDRQEIIRMLHDNSSVLPGRKVLVVDDDVRNIFALSSILQDQDMEVVIAKNGAEAVDAMSKNTDTDIVLMDIMMPVMDGYEAMKKIRAQERFSKLPIIALTAKAMKGARAECITAGASDYLSKPVDSEKLLSMMRVWLQH